MGTNPISGACTESVGYNSANNGIKSNDRSGKEERISQGYFSIFIFNDILKDAESLNNRH